MTLWRHTGVTFRGKWRGSDSAMWHYHGPADDRSAPVDLTSVADLDDGYRSAGGIDFVDDPVITHTNPHSGHPGQGPGTRRPAAGWCVGTARVSHLPANFSVDEFRGSGEPDRPGDGYGSLVLRMDVGDDAVDAAVEQPAIMTWATSRAHPGGRRQTSSASARRSRATPGIASPT